MQPESSQVRGEVEPAEMMRAVVTTLRERRGVDFSAYRAATLERRVSLHLKASGAASFEAYLERLSSDEAEADRLIGRLTIKVSSFFRGVAVYRHLGDQLALLDRTKPAGEPVRIWSAGCGQGQEPFSLALLLERTVSPARSRHILATDLDGEALQVARESVYPEAELACLSELDRQQYSQPLERRGQPMRRLNREVTRAVVFEEHDLCSGQGPDTRPFDLVLCRNVLIYWSRTVQERIQQMLVDSVAPNGLLCLGEADWLARTVRPQLDVIDGRHRLYRKLAAVRSHPASPEEAA